MAGIPGTSYLFRPGIEYGVPRFPEARTGARGAGLTHVCPHQPWHVGWLLYCRSRSYMKQNMAPLCRRRRGRILGSSRTSGGQGPQHASLEYGARTSEKVTHLSLIIGGCPYYSHTCLWRKAVHPRGLGTASPEAANGNRTGRLVNVTTCCTSHVNAPFHFVF
jgi:hypothetical protein